LREIQNQKVAYSRELTRNQLKNLKMYTDQLEKDQIKLRGFKHSYKDLIANLRTVADTGNYEAMTNSLSKLEDYSDSYFDNISMQLFKDLNNVKNPYLKSLLISKLTLISQHKTNCHFECKDVVDDVSINIFDLVRLLGISIDNAIEATNDQAHGEIQIAFVKDDQQLAILINNTTDTDNSVSDIVARRLHH
jgi:Predicted signal transduction protein with a C-terminal ATPase domain